MDFARKKFNYMNIFWNNSYGSHKTCTYTYYRNVCFYNKLLMKKQKNHFWRLIFFISFTTVHVSLFHGETHMNEIMILLDNVCLFLVFTVIIIKHKFWTQKVQFEQISWLQFYFKWNLTLYNTLCRYFTRFSRFF